MPIAAMTVKAPGSRRPLTDTDLSALKLACERFVQAKRLTGPEAEPDYWLGHAWEAHQRGVHPDYLGNALEAAWLAERSLLNLTDGRYSEALKVPAPAPEEPDWLINPADWLDEVTESVNTLNVRDTSGQQVA